MSPRDQAPAPPGGGVTSLCSWSETDLAGGTAGPPSSVHKPQGYYRTIKQPHSPGKKQRQNCCLGACPLGEPLTTETKTEQARRAQPGTVVSKE